MIKKDFQPKIIAFCCRWCSYAASDMAGTSRLEYPAEVKIIMVPCSGRVTPELVLKAFQSGADAVTVAGCHPGDCHYTSGNLFARRRMQTLSVLLDNQGIDPERFILLWASAAEGAKFAKAMQELTDKIKKLGPLERKT